MTALTRGEDATGERGVGRLKISQARFTAHIAAFHDCDALIFGVSRQDNVSDPGWLDVKVMPGGVIIEVRSGQSPAVVPEGIGH